MADRKSNGEILKAVLNIHEKLNGIDKRVGIVINKMKTVETTVLKHEKVLYGKPEEMGSGGLLHKQGEQDMQIKGLGKSIDNTRSTFVMIWTGIFAMIQLVIAGIRHFFVGNS